MNLIPFPAQLERTEGSLSAGGQFPDWAGEVWARWCSTFGLNLPTYSLVEQESRLDPGEYELVIGPSGIELSSGDHAARIHALATLFQLATQGADLPCLRIQDKPRFVWRGMHLDVGRHFMPASFVLKFLDLLALHKMNVFHWHLTEDQGWRIPIDRYPELTETGARRSNSMRTYKPPTFSDEPHSGCYTKEEIREVVACAAELGILVIPEIELPGHATAAIASYPELGNNPESQVEVATTWGVFDTVYAPTPVVFEFLDRVFEEVAELFPGPYVHIGGDECPKAEWKGSPFAQALIKSEGLKDEDHLQSWFIGKASALLTKHGKKLIGWDEILEGGLVEGATVMSWRGTQGGIEAARSGHKVIMTPWSHTYFDHYPGSWVSDLPHAIGGFTPIEKVYSFDPIPNELSPEEAENVLGAQGQLWTEYMPTPQHVEFMAFPRACALAEVLWGKGPGGFSEFEVRLKNWCEVLRRGLELSDDLPSEMSGEEWTLLPGAPFVISLPEQSVGCHWAIRIDSADGIELPNLVDLEVNGARTAPKTVQIGSSVHTLWLALPSGASGEVKLNFDFSVPRRIVWRSGPTIGRPEWANHSGLKQSWELAELAARGS